MPDDPDPPRKHYGFKAREFDRANSVPPAPAAPEAPHPAAGSPGNQPTPGGKIDINELINAGAAFDGKLGSNKVANRANEVHGMLRANLKRDIADGQYDLGTLDDSVRRRRVRKYWIIVLMVNIPVGTICVFSGPTNPIPFVLSLSLMVLFTSRLTWTTFFLRTHYRD